MMTLPFRFPERIYVPSPVIVISDPFTVTFPSSQLALSPDSVIWTASSSSYSPDRSLLVNAASYTSDADISSSADASFFTVFTVCENASFATVSYQSKRYDLF